MSKHNHKHSHCKHDMAHCDHCDVAYCMKCGKEWGANAYQSDWWYVRPYRYYPPTVTWGTTISSGLAMDTNSTNDTVVRDLVEAMGGIAHNHTGA